MAEIVRRWFEGKKRHRVIRAQGGTVSTAVVKPVPPCPYLGSPREETYTIRQVCKTCQGKRTSVLTLIVHDCAKQGRCLPQWRCNNALSEQELAGEAATACRQCEFNPTATPDSPEPHTPLSD